MSSDAQRTEHAVQQLVRYEALFKLLDDIQALEDVPAISACVARRWKYFANVAGWRLVVVKDGGFLVVDGCRGEATVTEVGALEPWDEYHWLLQRPSLTRMCDPVAVVPPGHLAGRLVTEIEVLPLPRMGGCIGLLSVAAGHEPFTELDRKFIRLFGGHFADRVSSVVLHRQATEVLRSRASRDDLTGLLNRGAIIERLRGRLALSRRRMQPLGVVIADIDFFKVINDSWGHLAGDEVLREMSRRLRMQMRDGDSLGRFGGEEFLFVLYPCGPREGYEAAERLRRVVCETPFSLGFEPPGELNVTISLGASGTADADAGMQGLLKRADDALYRSKAEGRNRVTVSSELLAG